MSTETILIIVASVLGFLALSILVIVVVGLFIWLINRSTVKTAVKEAVSHAKPTSINHGITINHNYGQETKDKEKLVEDETFLLASQCLGEFTKQFCQNFSEKSLLEKRRLKK